MRIGIDVRPIFGKSSGRRGIGRYTDGLVRALARNNRDHELFFYGYWDSALPAGYAGRHRSARRLDRPRLNWMIDAVLLPRTIRRDGLQVFQATDLTSVPRGGAGQIWATVHDLIPFVFWEKTVAVTPLDFRRALKWALRRLRTVDRIVTSSEYSRGDICTILEIPESRVDVVYPGRTECLGPLERDYAVRVLSRELGIDSRFLFYLGGSDFRKNLTGLLEAFSGLCKLGYPGNLVVGGETFLWSIPEVESVRRSLGRLSLEGRVLFPGYIDDGKLPLFFAGCDCFVFPSFYEGFGLPVLEAMQCGAAVVCARTSSLPEVAGDAAAYFDPSSVAELTRVLTEVCGDGDRLAVMRQAGLSRAALFDWDGSARRLLGLYAKHASI